jgi:hypothetical protein
MLVERVCPINRLEGEARMCRELSCVASLQKALGRRMRDPRTR